MRLYVLLKFAKILMISRLRGTRRSLVADTITSRPVIIALIGLGLFTIGLLLGSLTVSFIASSGSGVQSTSQIVFTIFGGVPIFLLGFFFSMGLLWELNASSDYESTDTINWLPITPAEYVLASALSTSYTYSPLVAVAIGYALPLGILSGNMSAFILLVIISLVSTFCGSMGVEVLRSVLARTSSTFNQLGGHAAIFLRLMGVVVILLFTQALFSGFLIVRLISALVGDVAATVAVPVFWPTLSITSLLSSNPLGAAVYGFLSVVFLLALSIVAFSLRSRFWVLSPPSFQFSAIGALAISRVTRLRRLGLSNIFAALLRREFRSATRRKEVIRLVAIPLVLPIMVIFPVIFSPAPTTTGVPVEVNPLLLAGPLLFGVGLGALFLGMTSIGQEGGRIWSLSSLPIGASIILKSKILFGSAVEMVGLCLALAISVLVFHLDLLSAVIFAGTGLAVVLAEFGLGLAIGARYADFSEGPRPRFVSMKGSILGSVLGIIMISILGFAFVGMLLLLVRLGISLNSYLVTTMPFLFVAIVALLFSRIGYRFSIGPFERILTEVPN